MCILKPQATDNWIAEIDDCQLAFKTLPFQLYYCYLLHENLLAIFVSDSKARDQPILIQHIAAAQEELITYGFVDSAYKRAQMRLLEVFLLLVKEKVLRNSGHINSSWNSSPYREFSVPT